MDEKCNNCPVLEVYLTCPNARKCLEDEDIPKKKKLRRGENDYEDLE